MILIDEQISESSELDDCGSTIKIDEKNFSIQSNFKKDITDPYTEHKDGECNFIIAYISSGLNFKQITDKLKSQLSMAIVFRINMFI